MPFSLFAQLGVAFGFCLFGTCPLGNRLLQFSQFFPWFSSSKFSYVVLSSLFSYFWLSALFPGLSWLWWFYFLFSRILFDFFIFPWDVIPNALTPLLCVLLKCLGFANIVMESASWLYIFSFGLPSIFENIHLFNQ